MKEMITHTLKCNEKIGSITQKHTTNTINKRKIEKMKMHKGKRKEKTHNGHASHINLSRRGRRQYTRTIPRGSMPATQH